MVTDTVVAFTAQRVTDQAFRIAFDQTIDGCFKFRILIFRMVLAFLIDRRHSDAFLPDGQRSCLILHRVVVQRCRSGHGNRIFTDVLAIRTAEAAVHNARFIAVLQAGHGSGKFGIIIAVGLGLVIRLDDQFCLGDCERTGLVNHIVVALYLFARRSDRVGSDILAFLTAEPVHHFVLADEARHSS